MENKIPRLSPVWEHCLTNLLGHNHLELWVISFLEINGIFPLIAVDVNELVPLQLYKGQSIGLVTAIVDGEHQLSKK